jgi:hypothetical protein
MIDQQEHGGRRGERFGHHRGSCRGCIRRARQRAGRLGSPIRGPELEYWEDED